MLKEQPVSKRPTLSSLAYFFYSEDGGDTFLRNFSSYKIHTAPHPKKTAFFIVTAVRTSNPSLH
jgi:hypothetical protein